MTPDHRPNIQQVAKEAGVGVGSVSRVFSGSPQVSPEMRDRVIAAAERLGFAPNLLARGLRGSSKTVGFVIADLANPLFADIVSGAEAELRQRGYSLLLVNSENNPEVEAEHVEFLIRRNVDGLLVCLASETHQPTLELLDRATQPLVVVDRDLPLGRQFGRVVSDHREGMLAAARHLIERGHRHVAVLLADDVLPTRGRREGLLEAYGEHASGFSFDAVRVAPSHDEATRAAGQLLDARPAPSALIVGGNQLLTGALDALAHRGLQIGRDIALVSFDNIALTRFIPPGISVVQRDNRELGRKSAELLLQTIDGELDPDHADIVLPTELVVRGSSSGTPRSSTRNPGPNTTSER